jgi:hypothetical protein
MPVPSLITDLSTTAASNSPAGAESARGTIDDYLRAHASFIASLRDNKVNKAGDTITGSLAVSTGDMLVGRASTPSSNSNVKGSTLVNDGRIIAGSDYTVGASISSNIFNAGANSANNMQFYRNGTAAGVIVTNSSAQTSYAASSDYRLKNNQQPLTGSGAFIDALQPKTWTWDTSGQPGAGFIAHEVAVVSPSSVFGEMDAVNDDGSPKYQSMEYGSPEFIANIVAELQSLRARVAELEAA